MMNMPLGHGSKQPKPTKRSGMRMKKELMMRKLKGKNYIRPRRPAAWRQS